MTEDEVKKAVRDALKEDRAAFWVESERHYNEHEFLRRVMNRIDNVSCATTWAIGVAFISLVGTGIWIIIQNVIKKYGGA